MAINVPPGTTLTVELDDGTKKTYVCKDGEWTPDATRAAGLVTVPISAIAFRR